MSVSVFLMAFLGIRKTHKPNDLFAQRGVTSFKWLTTSAFSCYTTHFESLKATVSF